MPSLWSICKTPWEERRAFGQWASTPDSEHKGANLHPAIYSDARHAEEAATKSKHTVFLRKALEANPRLSWQATRPILVTEARKKRWQEANGEAKLLVANSAEDAWLSNQASASCKRSTRSAPFGEAKEILKDRRWARISAASGKGHALHPAKDRTPMCQRRKDGVKARFKEACVVFNSITEVKASGWHICWVCFHMVSCVERQTAAVKSAAE